MLFCCFLQAVGLTAGGSQIAGGLPYSMDMAVFKYTACAAKNKVDVAGYFAIFVVLIRHHAGMILARPPKAVLLALFFGQRPHKSVSCQPISSARCMVTYSA